MTKNIQFFTSKVGFKIQTKAKLKNWILEVIDQNCKIAGDINFIVTNDKSLYEINLKYLNTDTYTDIITFSLSDEDEIISGDIYLSIERIKENAKKYHVTVEEEFRRILIHGIFHLLGFNDSTANEKRKMRRMENNSLKLYKIN